MEFSDHRKIGDTFRSGLTTENKLALVQKQNKSIIENNVLGKGISPNAKI